MQIWWHGDVIEIEISDGESIFWQDDDTLNDAPDGNTELQIMYVLLLQNQIGLNMSLMDFLFVFIRRIQRWMMFC